MGLFDSSKKVYVVKYLGGHPDIGKESPLNLTLEKDKVTVGLLKNKTVFTYEDIHIEQKTHEQISRNVTLGRVLLTGVFALAWRKKRVDRQHYLVCKQKDPVLGEIEFIMEAKNAPEIMSTFLKFKRDALMIKG